MFNKKTNFMASMAMVLGISMIPSLSNKPATALDLGEAGVYFDQAPRLVHNETMATYNTPNVRSTYYFTIAVPEDAGEPLKAVKINQLSNYEQIEFNVAASDAYIHHQTNGAEKVALSSIGGPKQEGEVTLIFDEPIQPGDEVEVGLQVEENPRFGGIYQFSVTAFPEGLYGQGLDLGIVRIHLYTGD
jgi:hypothetical protein